MLLVTFKETLTPYYRYLSYLAVLKIRLRVCRAGTFHGEEVGWVRSVGEAATNRQQRM